MYILYTIHVHTLHMIHIYITHHTYILHIIHIYYTLYMYILHAIHVYITHHTHVYYAPHMYVTHYTCIYIIHYTCIYITHICMARAPPPYIKKERENSHSQLLPEQENLMSKSSLLPPLLPPLLRVPPLGKEHPRISWPSLDPTHQAELWALGQGNSPPCEDLGPCDWNTAAEDPSSSHSANFLLSPCAPEAS